MAVHHRHKALVTPAQRARIASEVRGQRAYWKTLGLPPGLMAHATRGTLGALIDQAAGLAARAARPDGRPPRPAVRPSNADV